jgi:hypothetical protein
LDRLTHRCQIIETRGESYRLADAKERGRRTRPVPVDPVAPKSPEPVDEAPARE